MGQTMSAWAAGNFENDGALDYLGEVIDSLAARIEEIFADGWRAALDEEGESVLMPSVQMIHVLVENCKGAPPKLAQVQEWRDKYLEIFDEQIAGLEPQANYAVERRIVINDTFAKLEQQASIFWRK
jgi:hypothetical protein